VGSLWIALIGYQVVAMFAAGVLIIRQAVRRFANSPGVAVVSILLGLCVIAAPLAFYASLAASFQAEGEAR